MSRILAIDYGAKRCGIAVTDVLRIAVHPLKTVPRTHLLEFICDYLGKEEVEYIVMGDGRHANGDDSYVTNEIVKFISVLQKKNEVRVVLEDESFSSSDAKELIRKSGHKKKVRQDKSKVDLVSAVLILQSHLGHI